MPLTYTDLAVFARSYPIREGFATDVKFNAHKIYGEGLVTVIAPFDEEGHVTLFTVR